jgi:prolyl-tRNA synthetase
MAATIEQHNDEAGIIWPVAIAPYHVVIVPISSKDEAQMSLSHDIYQNLNASGIETIFDDRNERPGVKFKDADLIGYPLKVTVGPKAINEKIIEVKVRRTGEIFYFDINNYLDEIKALLATL